MTAIAPQSVAGQCIERILRSAAECAVSARIADGGEAGGAKGTSCRAVGGRCAGSARCAESAHGEATTVGVTRPRRAPRAHGRPRGPRAATGGHALRRYTIARSQARGRTDSALRTHTVLNCLLASTRRRDRGIGHPYGTQLPSRFPERDRAGDSPPRWPPDPTLPRARPRPARAPGSSATRGRGRFRRPRAVVMLFRRHNTSACLRRRWPGADGRR